jgi:transaldolase/glucose-6-phosphate isomerase
MRAACSATTAENVHPAILLGAAVGEMALAKRDKVTFLCSPSLTGLPSWIEQLIAESTGKERKGIIPVASESLAAPETYGADRFFVYLRLDGDENHSLDRQTAALEANGHPLARIELKDKYDLGQEFFRWEFATAVAGSVMGINPFDQPDVESAKIEARKITDEYEKTGSLPDETPFFEADGVRLFSGEKYAAQLNDSVGEEKTLRRYLTEHISRAGENDYFALLAYVEMNDENARLLQALRERILGLNHAASALGFGPRFLHSTGQAYKGGANNGVFLQITSDDEFDLAVPGQSYTFGVVKTAQARGDFQVLLDRDRRALRIHLGANVREGLNGLLSLLDAEKT